MSMPDTAQTDPLIVLPKVDFSEIVLLHEFDQFANAIDVKNIITLANTIRLFIRFRHRAAFPTWIGTFTTGFGPRFIHGERIFAKNGLAAKLQGTQTFWKPRG